MKTDTLFYRLFQTRPQLLFDLLDIELPVASAYRFQSVDLKQTAFRLDGVFIDLLETIMVYKLPTLSREEIQRMIGLPEVDLKQTRFYQDVFTEGLQEGRQEGLQEGRQEGLQEGRQEGLQEGLQEGRQQEAIALALQLLRRKFGNLTADLDTRLHTLPLSQIEALVDALFDFTSLSDLETWLSQQPPTELEDEDP